MLILTKPVTNTQAKKELLKDLGNKVRLIRKAKNMSQDELARRCFADKRKIGGVERGEYDFRFTSIMVLAKALETDVQNLLNFELINTLKEDIWLL